MLQEKEYLFSDSDIKKLIVPLILELILTLTVGMCDSIMVAYVGEDAVSGVSIVDNIFVLIQYTFAALAAGGAVVAGQYLGMENRQKACHTVNQLIIFLTGIGILVAILLYLYHSYILVNFFSGITAQVRKSANIYLLITSASVPFLALISSGFAIFRTENSARLALKISLFMNAINLGGNAILVYVLKLGTLGVAIPTLVSRISGAIVVLLIMLKQSRLLHISLPFRFVIQKKLLQNILYIGVPNGFESFMFESGKLILLTLISQFGTASIAADAIGNKLACYEVLPGTAIGLATITIVSRCVGAADF